jgi:FSR family fosmidomycin resistance protein-like MFS transporter
MEMKETETNGVAQKGDGDGNAIAETTPRVAEPTPKATTNASLSKRDVTYFKSLTTFGHFAADLCQGALPAIFPFLILYFGYSYSSSAGLLFASSLVSSISQPILGHIGDKKDKPWFMGAGILIASIGIAGIGVIAQAGLLDLYWLVFLDSAVVGFGVALFHPEGAKISNLVSGDKKAQGIGVFAIGGNIGFVISPVIVTAVVTFWGMPGLTVIFIPCLLASILMFVKNRRLKEVVQITEAQSANVAETKPTQKDDWPAFIKIQVVVFVRSIITFGLRTFIPMFFIVIFAQSVAVGNSALAVFSIASAISMVVGGIIADKIGYKRMIVICSALTVPILAVFLISPNVYMGMVMVALISLALNSSYSTTIALSQSYLPNRIGLASGIALGMAISVGGLVAPALGFVSDTFGLMTAMIVVTVLSAIVLLFSLMIKSDKKKAPLKMSEPKKARNLRYLNSKKN